MSEEPERNWNSEEKTLTQKQAYLAMFHFLDQYYEITKSDEIGGLLGSLSLWIWTDRMPADPAFVKSWDKAVKAALAG